MLERLVGAVFCRGIAGGLYTSGLLEYCIWRC